MGVDACAQTYDGGHRVPIRPGGFWMPCFTGCHLSLDLKRFPNEWEVYEQAVEPFLRTDRLSASERAMLMGGACAKAYGWSPKRS